MEHTLRCNSLPCRHPLDDRAVVTTCSHIFCLPCSDSLHLTSPPEGRVRSCPACNVQLPHPDDAVIAQLNPSEEYKTSVLSGLTPTVVLECAGRALGFYGYQCVQEIHFQEHLVRKVSERNTVLGGQIEKLCDDANGEIKALRDRIDAMHLEQRKLEDKNIKLADALRDKSKKLHQCHNSYTKLKQQQNSGILANAADTDAENILQNAAAAAHDNSAYHAAPQLLQRRAGSNGSGRRHSGYVQPAIWNDYAGAVQRPGMQSSGSAQLNMTPSGHRQALHQQVFQNNISNAALQGGTPQRTPLGPLSQNLSGKWNSPYMGGMSNGVKVGRRPTNGIYRQAVGGRMNGHGYG